MKKLSLGFHSSTQKTLHRLQLNYVEKELSPQEVQQTMQEIASLQLFVDKEGQKLLETPVSAAYVTTATEPLFGFKK